MEKTKLIEKVKSSLGIKITKYKLKESLNSIEESAKNLINDENIGDYSKRIFHEIIANHTNKVAYLQGKIDTYKEILEILENLENE